MTFEFSRRVSAALKNIPDQALHQKFLDIHLYELPECFRKSTLKRLMACRIENIKALIDLDIEELSKQKGIWKKSVNEIVSFINVIITDPQRILSIYDNNCPIILPTKEVSNNFIRLFIELLTEYLSSQSSREVTIFVKRFSLDGSEKKTLDKLGTDFNISRERIRQLVNIHIATFRQLTNGEVIYFKNNQYKCHDAALEVFRKIKSILYMKPFFVKEEFIALLKLEGIDTDYPESEEPYLVLLLEVLNMQVSEFNSQKVLTPENKGIPDDLMPDLNLVSKCIHKILNKVSIPMRDLDLYQKVNKSFKNIDFKYFTLCCTSDSAVELIKTDWEHYQLKMEFLSSLCNCVYRILYNNNKPMHLTEILHQVLGPHAFDSSKPNYISHNSLHLDKRLAPVGKMGVWTLTSWKKNTQKIRELIEDILAKENKPVSFKDLYKLILKKRPEIKYTSMTSILNQKDAFAFTADHSVILRSWTHFTQVSFTRIKSIPNHVLDQALISVFKKKEKCTASELYTLLRKNGVLLSNSNIKSRVNKSPVVKWEINGRKNVYSLMERSTPRTLEPFVKDLMIQSVQKAIENSPLKKKKLSEIVKELRDSHDFNKYSLYGIVNEQNGFLKETTDQNEILISFKNIS